MTPGAPRLTVLADLDLQVGTVHSTVRTEGDHVVLRTDSPQLMWSAISGAALPLGVGRMDGVRAIGRVADLLDESGVALDIVGPRGVLVRFGRDADSRLGRVVTGSRSVGFGSPRALLSALIGRLRIRR